MNQDQTREIYRRTFEAVAASYDDPALRFFRSAAEELPAWLALPVDARVLDVATGTGWAAAALARSLPAGEVTGIDLSPGMLSQARRKVQQLGLDNVTLQEMDMQSLAVADASFDAAISAFSIFFVEDMERQLAHIASKVRPGGAVATTTFESAAFTPLADRFLERMAGYGIVPPSLAWKRVASEAQCVALFRAAGLMEVRCTVRDLSYWLEDAEQWWQVIWNGGFRSLVEQLDAERRERFRREHLAEIQDLVTREGIRLRMPVLFTRGRCPTGTESGNGRMENGGPQ